MIEATRPPGRSWTRHDATQVTKRASLGNAGAETSDGVYGFINYVRIRCAPTQCPTRINSSPVKRLLDWLPPGHLSITSGACNDITGSRER